MTGSALAKCTELGILGNWELPVSLHVSRKLLAIASCLPQLHCNWLIAKHEPSCKGCQHQTLLTVNGALKFTENAKP
jgi:hypothetical protein